MRRRDWLVGFIGLSAALMAGPAMTWASNPDSPIGLWRTIDDKTHKPRGVVRISEHEGVLVGVVTAILDRKYDGMSCRDCTDDRKGEPVMGMEIIRGMRPQGDHWGGGTVLNPQNGKIYRCRMQMGANGQTLVVRAFIGTPLIGRTQTWQRLSG